MQISNFKDGYIGSYNDLLKYFQPCGILGATESRYHLRNYKYNTLYFTIFLNFLYILTSTVCKSIEFF